MCPDKTQVFKLTNLQCLDLSRNKKYKLGLAVTAITELPTRMRL